MRPAHTFPLAGKPVLTVMGQTGVNLVTAADSQGKLSLTQFHVPKVGMGVPAHVHRREDEFFHVLQGTIRVNVGGIETTLEAGQSVIGPRDVVHAWESLADDSVILVAATPAGLDEMFVELARATQGRPEMESILAI